MMVPSTFFSFYETKKFPIGILIEKAITLRGGQLVAKEVNFSPISTSHSPSSIILIGADVTNGYDATSISKQFPYLLDLVLRGEHDRSFIFDYEVKQ